ncbi:MAG: ABC transporter permease [Pseudomonadota bacterium]
MRIEKRPHVSILWLVSAPLLASLAALILSAALIIWAGQSPLRAYQELVLAALGSRGGLAETLSYATPLIFTGLAAAIAFRAKFWNIGGEGQLYIGACAATALGTGILTAPPVILIPLLFIAGALAGGILLVIPVILKTALRVDEVVTTLLLNFIVLLVVSFLIEGPWRDPMALGWPQAAPIIDEGVLPKLLDRTRLHIGFLVAVGCAVISWFVMQRTVWGFEIRAVGLAATAAAFAGMRVTRVVVIAALISGAMAGMAGVSEVAGLKGYMTLDLSPGFGYTGIAVAMLAGLHLLAVVPAAIFLSAVYVGADSMSRTLDIPTYLADVLVALSVLAILVCTVFARYRLRFS